MFIFQVGLLAIYAILKLEKAFNKGVVLKVTNCDANH